MDKGKHGWRGGRRRSVWTVLIPGRRSLPDDDGNTRPVPPQAYNFRDKKRAKRLAGNIQGSKLSGPQRFWTAKRVVIAIVILAVLICIARANQR